MIIRWFRKMMLDDQAIEIATDPGVSSKDENERLSNPRKRTSPASEVATPVSLIYPPFLFIFLIRCY